MENIVVAAKIPFLSQDTAAGEQKDRAPTEEKREILYLVTVLTTEL